MKSKLKENIIIIDDTPANLKLLEGMLIKHDYQVRPFPKGSLAIKAAIEEPPDIILLDIKMPEMDGYEVCRILKQDKQLQDIPVIFISAYTEPIDKVKAFGAGGIDYITKPFHLEEVQARVKTHLALRKYRLQLEQKNRELLQTLDKLKKAQSQIIQSEKMASLGVLTAGIAHEINNPINFINSAFTVIQKYFNNMKTLLKKYNQLKRDNFDSQLKEITEYKEDINYQEVFTSFDEVSSTMKIGIERTVEIIKGLRIFARLDESEFKPSDVHENLNATLTLLHNRYKNIITIKKEYGDIPIIPCMPGKLNQVFMNILSNAIEAIEAKIKKGEIKVKEEHKEIIKIQTSKTDNTVCICISDTGIGIKRSNINRIFEPFFTTKEVGKGTGLGLAISMGIIESHKGKIEVASKLGVGTEVNIYLPVEKKNEW